MAQLVSLILIHRIVIYPVDGAIQPLNNWSLPIQIRGDWTLRRAGHSILTLKLLRKNEILQFVTLLGVV